MKPAGLPTRRTGAVRMGLRDGQNTLLAESFGLHQRPVRRVDVWLRDASDPGLGTLAQSGLSVLRCRDDRSAWTVVRVRPMRLSLRTLAEPTVPERPPDLSAESDGLAAAVVAELTHPGDTLSAGQLALLARVARPTLMDRLTELPPLEELSWAVDLGGLAARIVRWRRLPPLDAWQVRLRGPANELGLLASAATAQLRLRGIDVAPGPPSLETRAVSSLRPP